MNWRLGSLYNERVLPRMVDAMCANPEMLPWREKVIAGLEGVIVEIGFGSGANTSVYPAEVTRVFAVEPSQQALRLAEPKLAAERATRSAAGAHYPMVEQVGLTGELLPLATDSCDGALSTFTLCTIPDVSAALNELRRVIKPGGQFHFLEHGLSPDAPIAKWQRRLDPLQGKLAGGCHLTREMAELVEASGFEIESITSRYARGPKPWTWFSIGRAINPETAANPQERRVIQ